MAAKKSGRGTESGTFRAARCGEFPNDNPELHAGLVSYDWEEEEADLAREPIEVVDELAFEDAVDERLDPGFDEAEAPAAEGDAFAAFVQVLEAVARSFGADEEGASRLLAELGQAGSEGVAPDPRAIAWRGVLRGDSDDFGPCGAETLDEWAAGVVSRVIPAAGRTEAIRRELRSRGVAAFGFMADAA